MKTTRIYIVGLSAMLVACVNAEIQVQNTSFDQYDAKGRTVGWALTGNFRTSKGEGHNGSSGLVWESKKPCGNLHTAIQRIIGVAPGDMLEFQALVRKDGFKTAANQGSVFSIEMRDANDKWICARYAVMKRDQPNGEWTLVKSSAVVPQNAKNAVIMIYVSGDSYGKVSWDNVVVKRVDAKPVKTVVSSAYQSMAVNGKVSFHAALRISDDFADKSCSAVFVRKNAIGVSERIPAATFSRNGASVEFNVADMAMGSQEISCELCVNGKVIDKASTSFTRVERLPSRLVYIDSHGRCIVQGKPFFPLGIYWNPNEKQLGIVKDSPFNCAIHYEMMTKERLDFCEKVGILTFSSFDRKLFDDDRGKLARHIESVRRHPALLGWYLGDEVEAVKAPYQKEVYDFFRGKDPDHPCYIVQDRTYDLREFADAADVFGLDPYPVSQKSVNTVTKFMRDGMAALFGSKPMWSVPQAFSWQWYRPAMQDIERFPSAAEMRSMNWQHIAGGANGLISFALNSFFYPSNKYDWRPLWAQVVEVNREIARLIPVLLSVEDAPRAAPDSTDMVCRTWVKDGELFLLACNLSEKPLYASAMLSGGDWKVVGTEVGTPATSDGSRRVRFYLNPIGVSLVRLKPRPGIPEPRPVKTDIELHAFYYPGTEQMAEWDLMDRTMPWTKPLLGWYDEGDPDVVDWQIKWAVEHGIGAFCVDWYWHRGVQRLNHWVNAYYRSRFRKYLPWYIMYANHNDPGSHTVADTRRLVKFWCDNYFKTPEYYKIDGVPVVVLWDYRNLGNDFAAEAKANRDEITWDEGLSRALMLMRETAREFGVPGIHFIDVYHGWEDCAPSEILKKAGYDGQTLYGFDKQAYDMGAEYLKPGDNEKRFDFSVVCEAIRRWWENSNRNAAIPFWPFVPTGWDCRPRNFQTPRRVIYGRTPEKFRKMLEDCKAFCRKTGMRRIMIGPVNEWQEGSYVEPNEEYGFAMYDAIRDVFATAPKETYLPNVTPSDLDLGPYDFPPMPRLDTKVWDFSGGDTLGWCRNPYGTPVVRNVDRSLHFIRVGSKYGAIRTRVVPFPAEDWSAVKITMRIDESQVPEWAYKGASRKGFLRWGTVRKPLIESDRTRDIVMFDMSRRAEFSPVADGKWHEYVVNLDGVSGWSGDVDELWLDPYDIFFSQIFIRRIEFVCKKHQDRRETK